jgi:hypothetical protein
MENSGVSETRKSEIFCSPDYFTLLKSRGTMIPNHTLLGHAEKAARPQTIGTEVLKLP